MKLKRCLSMLLAVMLVACTIPHAAFAEAAEKKVYNYVALGDSITAGFGLTSDAGNLAEDKALILTDERIADPVMEAYPMVFGEMIKPLGQEKGFTTEATNLALTAYRAQDIAQTIRETCKGEVAESILEGFVGQGASAPLTHYHDIYEQYLPEADLVSIELGGNDIVMAVLVPMLNSENPILKATSLSLALTLFGADTQTALGAGYLILSQNKDQITYEAIVEATNFFKEVGKNADSYVQNAADQVEGVVQATKEKNPDANIALLGMFNPFAAAGEESTDKLLEELDSIIRYNVNESATLMAEAQGEEVEEVLCEALSDSVNDSDVILAAQADDDDNSNAILDSFMEYLKSTASSLVNQLAASSVEPQMLKLNELTQALAEKYGATYVDVWGISTGNDADPHPDAQGHKEIAERMFAILADLIGLKDAEVTKAPVANTLTYNGSAQELVQAGEASGGDMVYSLDGENFDAALPTATDAGKYTVYYKASGDKKHFDSKVQKLTVTIAKAAAPTLTSNQKAKAISPIIYDGSKQALVTAPKELPEGYTGVRYSTDGGATWKKAIPTGKKVDTYSVQVKYVADKNHTTFVAKAVKAKIIPCAYAVVTTHVQRKGWIESASAGMPSGSTGQSLRMEAVKIEIPDHNISGGIEYRSHVQTYGWERSWAHDGLASGTEGESKRLEAIQIRLYGDMAKKYDVYYRVHAQRYGWMGWAKNGEQAGTAGMSYRLESLQVVLVKKGAPAPSTTYKGVKQAYAAPFAQK